MAAIRLADYNERDLKRVATGRPGLRDMSLAQLANLAIRNCLDHELLQDLTFSEEDECRVPNRKPTKAKG